MIIITSIILYIITSVLSFSIISKYDLFGYENEFVRSKFKGGFESYEEMNDYYKCVCIIWPASIAIYLIINICIIIYKSITLLNKLFKKILP